MGDLKLSSTVLVVFHGNQWWKGVPQPLAPNINISSVGQGLQARLSPSRGHRLWPRGSVVSQTFAPRWWLVNVFPVLNDTQTCGTHRSDAPLIPYARHLRVLCGPRFFGANKGVTSPGFTTSSRGHGTRWTLVGPWARPPSHLRSWGWQTGLTIFVAFAHPLICTVLKLYRQGWPNPHKNQRALGCGQFAARNLLGRIHALRGPKSDIIERWLKWEHSPLIAVWSWHETEKQSDIGDLLWLLSHGSPWCSNIWSQRMWRRP